MSWLLDNPIICADASNNNTSFAPAYDGKNLWVLQNDNTVKCIEFWGPYSDIVNDENNCRYLAAELDTISLPTIGPALRVLHNFATGLTSITGFCYYENYIYVMGTSGGANTLIRWPITASSAGSITTLCTTIAAGGDIACANGNVYFVDVCPTTQTTTDVQKLHWITISACSGAYLVSGTTALTDTKQVAPRHLVVSNNYLYVSSYNTLSVLQFNATTGAFITSITVNRDVDRLFRVGNNIWVISSLKGQVSGTPASMVSQIDLSNTVTTLFGIMHTGAPISGCPITLAADTNYTWFNTDTGGIQRTHNSDLKSFVMGTGDYGILSTHSGLSVTGSTPSVNSSISIAVTQGVFITQPLTYNWWNGSSFTTINVPSYLFIISQTGIVMVALPSVFKWDATSLTLNQYAAVSTGGSGYKAG